MIVSNKEWDDIPEGRDKEPTRLIVSAELNPWEEADERTDIQRERDLLKVQLRTANQYGHTDDQRKIVEGPGYKFEAKDCEVCQLENLLIRLDELEHGDWREQNERQVEKTMRPLERVMPGGAVY